MNIAPTIDFSLLVAGRRAIPLLVEIATFYFGLCAWLHFDGIFTMIHIPQALSGFVLSRIIRNFADAERLGTIYISCPSATTYSLQCDI